MADCNPIVYLHYNVLDQQPNDFLTFRNAEVLCGLPEAANKPREGLFQLLGLFGDQGFPPGVLQFLLGGLLLAPKFRHPLSQLLQFDQALLISIQEFVDLVLGALEALL